MRETARRNTRSPSVENWLWKRLWTGCKEDCGMDEIMNERRLQFARRVRLVSLPPSTHTQFALSHCHPQHTRSSPCLTATLNTHAVRLVSLPPSTHAQLRYYREAPAVQMETLQHGSIILFAVTDQFNAATLINLQ